MRELLLYKKVLLFVMVGESKKYHIQRILQMEI